MHWDESMSLFSRIRRMHVRRLYETLAPSLKASPVRLATPDRGRVLYKSQLSAHNWRGAAVSLNRHRGITSGAGEYAEAFMRYSVREYFKIWKSVYDR
jgi:hypothetical protein